MKTLLVALLGGGSSAPTPTSTSVIVNGFESLAIAQGTSNAEPRGTPKPLGTREGAIRGLVGIGKEAVRKGVLEGGGARVVGEECAASGGDGVDGVVDAVMVRLELIFHSLFTEIAPDQIALQTLYPISDMPESLDRTREEDVKLIAQLSDMFGEFFTEKIVGRGDRPWALGIVQSVHG